MGQDNTLSNRKEQAVFLQSGDPTKERRVPDSYSGGQLGQRFSVPDIHTEWADVDRGPIASDWQLVQLDSVMDTLPWDGAVAWWVDRARYLVTTDISRGLGRGARAGIFRDSDAPQTATTHHFTLSDIVCIQKKGVPAVHIESGTPDATGLFVIPGTADGKAIALSAAGTAATYPPLGTSASTAVSSFALVDLDVNDTP